MSGVVACCIISFLFVQVNLARNETIVQNQSKQLFQMENLQSRVTNSLIENEDLKKKLHFEAENSSRLSTDLEHSRGQLHACCHEQVGEDRKKIERERLLLIHGRFKPSFE